jgi:transposase
MAAQYKRLAVRRGKTRALMALGHTLLIIVYHVLTRKQPYHDWGAAYCDARAKQRGEQRLGRRLDGLV